MQDIIFLTGASSGIGAALAESLAKKGHAVALVARRTEALNDLAQRIQKQGGTALAIPCDVSDRQAVHNAVQQCRKNLGPITRLIANAGIGIPTPVKSFDASIIERVFQINVMGATYCIEAILPDMIARQQGHIVGISSIASFMGLPASGAYSASKAALSTLFESLRFDLQRYHIDVTLIHPGFIKTPMTARNRFPMPMLMELDYAINEMEKAILKRKAVLNFPSALALPMRIASLLPKVWIQYFFKGLV